MELFLKRGYQDKASNTCLARPSTVNTSSRIAKIGLVGAGFVVEVWDLCLGVGCAFAKT